jgi:HK97 family phage major capsid protein
MSEQSKIAEELKSTLATIQDRNESLQAQGLKTSEGLEELKGKFDESLVKLEEANQKIAEEKAAREAVELAMSRLSENVGEKDMKGSAEYAKAFSDFLVSRGRKEIDSKSIEKEIEKAARNNDRLAAEMKMLFVGSNPDGGYLVPQDLSTRILTRQREITPFRQVVNVESTNRDKRDFPIDDDNTQNAKWADELDSRGDTGTPQLGLIEIPVHEIWAKPLITNMMLEDAGVNIESWLSGKVASDFAKRESESFTIGNGTKRPKGFLAYPTTAVETYKQGYVMERQTAANDTLSADDLIKLQGNLKEAYQGNAAFMMNRQFFSGEVLTLKDSQGSYLIDPRLLFNGAAPQLLGRPVVFNPELATAVADGARPVAYGDWREFYTIVDRIMMTVLRDPYTDDRGVKFKFRKRVGGGITNFEAVKTLKIQ